MEWKRELIKDIAEDIDCGFKCFIHITTKEIITIPEENEYPDVDIPEWKKDSEVIRHNLKDYIEIKRMNSNDLFQTMADFVETVDNSRLREKLVEALERRKPFHNFKFTVDNSGVYRDRWFEFKAKKLEEWVIRQLQENEL
jgi:hypothetical protein